MTGLKNLLDDLGDQAKPYDVLDRAIIGGRRRRRARLAAVPVCAGLVAVAALLGSTVWGGGTDRTVPLGPLPTVAASPSPARPPFPTSCTVHRLSPPKGATQSLAHGMDPTGRLITGRFSTSREEFVTDYRSVMWVDGEPKILHTQGNDILFPYVTSTGTAVGRSMDDGTPVWWVYQDDKATRLRGKQIDVRAVNDHGVILGLADGRPALWRTPTGDPEFVSLPAGLPEGWSPMGIDDDGTLLGKVQNGRMLPSLFVVSPQGQARQLAPVDLPNGKSGGAVITFGIRGGFVTGEVLHGMDPSNPRIMPSPEVFDKAGIRWNLDTGETSVSTAIGGRPNVNGWQLGRLDNRNILMDGDRSVLLPDSEGGTSSPSEMKNAALSDDGRTITGFQQFAKPVRHLAAVVWHCS